MLHFAATIKRTLWKSYARELCSTLPPLCSTLPPESMETRRERGTRVRGESEQLTPIRTGSVQTSATLFNGHSVPIDPPPHVGLTMGPTRQKVS